MKTPKSITLPLSLAESTTTIPIRDAKGKTIASVKYGKDDLDHAQFVRRACNTHDDFICLSERLIQWDKDFPVNSHNGYAGLRELDRIIADFKNALVKSEL